MPVNLFGIISLFIFILFAIFYLYLAYNKELVKLNR